MNKLFNKCYSKCSEVKAIKVERAIHIETAVPENKQLGELSRKRITNIIEGINVNVLYMSETLNYIYECDGKIIHIYEDKILVDCSEHAESNLIYIPFERIIDISVDISKSDEDEVFDNENYYERMLSKNDEKWLNDNRICKIY